MDGDRTETIACAQCEVPCHVAASADAVEVDAVLVDVVAPPRPTHGGERGEALALGESVAHVRAGLGRADDDHAELVGGRAPLPRHAASVAPGEVKRHQQRRGALRLVRGRDINGDFSVLDPAPDAQGHAPGVRPDPLGRELAKAPRGAEPCFQRSILALREFGGGRPALPRRLEIDDARQLRTEILRSGHADQEEPDNRCTHPREFKR